MALGYLRMTTELIASIKTIQESKTFLSRENVLNYPHCPTDTIHKLSIKRKELLTFGI